LCGGGGIVLRGARPRNRDRGGLNGTGLDNPQKPGKKKRPRSWRPISDLGSTKAKGKLRAKGRGRRDLPIAGEMFYHPRGLSKWGGARACRLPRQTRCRGRSVKKQGREGSGDSLGLNVQSRASHQEKTRSRDGEASPKGEKSKGARSSSHLKDQRTGDRGGRAWRGVVVCFERTAHGVVTDFQ